MTNAVQLLSAIAKFDEVAVGDSTLSDGLRELAHFYGAHAITLETWSRETGEMVGFEEWGIDPASTALYAQRFADISPRVAFGIRAHPSTIVHDDLIGTPQEFERTEFFGDFLERSGLRYFMSLTVDPDPAIFSVMALQFTRAAGAVDSEDIRVAKALRPVLADRFGRAWRRQRGMDARFVEADLYAKFGLTPSEARLAVALLEGRSVVEHAAHAKVTRNTAYTHYAAMKAKLGETRQAGLMKRLLAHYAQFASR